MEVNELLFDSEFSEDGQGDGRSRPIVWVVVISIGAVGDSSLEVFPSKGPVSEKILEPGRQIRISVAKAIRKCLVIL